METNEAIQKEKETIERLKREQPDLVIPASQPDEQEVLTKIGIEIPWPERSVGYLRYYPQDFIVEEIQVDGRISTIDPSRPSGKLPRPAGNFTLFTDLIKVNISTIDAVYSLAKHLDMPPTKIGYAGLKDNVAITSQRVTIPKRSIEEATSLESKNIYISNPFYDQGFIRPGYLWGNRFTLLVRTQEKVEQTWINSQLKNLSQNGFLNFYQSQRFGTPRLQNHDFGLLVLQRKYEEAIRQFLINAGKYELPFVKALRQQAQENYGNWDKMKEIYQELPHTLQWEIKLVEYLKDNPDDYLGALHETKDMTRMLVYAYSSYLFNKRLSELAQAGQKLPKTLPLLLSPSSQDHAVYKSWLPLSSAELLDAVKPFQYYMPLRRRQTPTRIFPKGLEGATGPGGVVVHFSLPKGVYATTFLMNLFQLQEGQPVPEWINKEEFDSLQILGQGSVENIKAVLGVDNFVNPGL